MTTVQTKTLAEARSGLPLTLTPAGAPDAAALAEWLAGQREWTQTQLREHGALLLRGFSIDSPPAFEAVARAIDPDLKNEYLGTSPRDAVTDYVFSASELPGYYPIPQHCEMTFTKTPPRRIFFWCQTAPATGGETPLVDFRAVWRELPDAVRQRFSERRIRIIRNYTGPDGDGGLMQLKRWDQMFQTTDREAVSARARAEGFEPHWSDGDRLALISEHDAMRPHPETGEPVWFNHAQVFHLHTGPDELGRIFRRRPSPRALYWWLLSAALAGWKRLRVAPEKQAMHVTWADGSEISRDDIAAVRDAIWKNLVVIPWQQGDVVAIDNNAVGHGRLPYRGPRTVMVCWA